MITIMFLRIFTLLLDSNRSRLDTFDELRPFLAKNFSKYAEAHKDRAADFTHRYPVVQVKIVQDWIMVLGINEGADFLSQFSVGIDKFATGRSTCTIVERDASVRNEEFGISRGSTTYEFQSPWLALNEQNAKKFYELNGKAERDAFINGILARNLATLAKSLGYAPALPITAEAKVRFKKERVGDANEMVFIGRFATNLAIPDYFGIGQSVSLGFGTVRTIPGDEDTKTPTIREM